MKTIEDIEVKMIADSVNTNKLHGVRLSTLELYYPRMVHAEFMTHRMLTKNASSSRAIPVVTMLEKSKNDLYMPLFRENQTGMQPGKYLTDDGQTEAAKLWVNLAEHCMTTVAFLASKNGLNIHKQWANRPLEWFGWIRVLTSSTDWANFFDLRMEKNDEGWPMAQDEIAYLAEKMSNALEDGSPVERKDTWHLPYVMDKERELYKEDVLLRMSAARCARTSYDQLDGTPNTVTKDLELYEKLTSGKIHATPLEHQAFPDMPIFNPRDVDDTGDYESEKRRMGWMSKNEWGNFYGWRQHRKMIPNNTVREHGRGDDDAY